MLAAKPSRPLTVLTGPRATSPYSLSSRGRRIALSGAADGPHLHCVDTKLLPRREARAAKRAARAAAAVQQVGVQPYGKAALAVVAWRLVSAARSDKRTAPGWSGSPRAACMSHMSTFGSATGQSCAATQVNRPAAAHLPAHGKAVRGPINEVVILHGGLHVPRVHDPVRLRAAGRWRAGEAAGSLLGV